MAYPNQIVYDRIKLLYNQGRITEAQVYIYVDKGIITQEQADEIIRGN